MVEKWKETCAVNTNKLLTTPIHCSPPKMSPSTPFKPKMTQQDCQHSGRHIYHFFTLKLLTYGRTLSFTTNITCMTSK